jgi:hypothetical protein
MNDHLAPADVFSPNRIPVKEHQAYAARVDAEAALKRAVSRSQVPVIYGEFGVGKTTLAKRYFLTAEQMGRFVHILSPSGKNLDDLVRVALEKLHYSVEVGGDARTTRTDEAGVDVGVFTPLRARFTGRRERQETIRTELLVRSPTDQGFLEIMADREMVLVIDEMHKASDGFRLQLAELIKATINLGRGFPIIVVLGTALDASRLVAHDEGIDRLIAEVEVRPMTDEEAKTVVRDGMSKLAIEIADERVARVVSTAAGAPALLQEICLDVAESSLADERRVVESRDIDAAIKLFLFHRQRRLTAKYVAAIENTGSRRYRKLILRAMAESPHDFVTMDELTNRVSGYLGMTGDLDERVPSNALSGPLRELKEPERGAILTDVERPTGVGRLHNLTAFNDPKMKAFIRAMGAVDDQGLLPTEGEVAALPPSVHE